MRDRAFYSGELEAPANWRAVQDRLARQAVAMGFQRSAEVRRRMERARVSIEDIHGVRNLAKLSVLRKDDIPELQAADPPFGGMLGVPVDELRRILQSPGPILDPQGDRPDFWRLAPALWAAGFRAGHIVLNSFSYHLTPGGHMLEGGLREVRCVVIPGGVGSTGQQLSLAARAGATAYVGTPQFLLTLLENGAELDPPYRFARALVTGAPLPDPLRSRLQQEFRVDVFQAYGTADAGALGYECAAKSGWHIAPQIVIEIADPESGAPVDPGDPGEVVVTSPNDVYPLVRLGTGDISAIESTACGCGRTSPRLVGFLGRVGDGVKVRGMFVHPRQLEGVLTAAAGVARFQGVVSAAGHQDVFTVSIEPTGDGELDATALARALSDAAGVRVELDIVEPGTLPDDPTPLVDGRERPAVRP